LADLDARLTRSPEAGLQVVALHGLGGSDTTTVAAKYGIVIWPTLSRRLWPRAPDVVWSCRVRARTVGAAQQVVPSPRRPTDVTRTRAIVA
jgi:predicted esterase